MTTSAPQQLDIPQCGTAISLRYCFQIPVYSRSGKLGGFKGVRVVVANIIDKELFAEFFKHDLNKLMVECREIAVEKVMKVNKLETREFLTFMGYEYCEHRIGTAPSVDDPRWV